MSNKNLDADIVYDYLVNDDSQQTIADNYGLNQREVSNILTKDYGLNKGNVAWGTGKNNQKGCYPNLSYDDIYDFVNSGSKNIDAWLKNRYKNDNYIESDFYDDDYDDEDDYDDDEDDFYNIDFGDKGTRYGDTRPVKKQVVVNRPSFDLPSFNGNFSSILLLCFAVIILSVLVKIKAILQVFPSYLKLLWTGNYVYIMIGFAVINLLVRLALKKETIGEIFDEPRIYYWLGAGFIFAGIKLLFDMSFSLIWPGALPIIIGLAIILFIKWLDNH